MKDCDFANKTEEKCESPAKLSNRHYPKLKNQDNRLKEICYRKLCEISGCESIENVPGNMKARLDWELEAVKKQRIAFIFLYIREVLERVNLKAHNVCFRGTVGNSFIAYLCDMTETNPIEYHLPKEVAFGLCGDREYHVEMNIPRDMADVFWKSILKLEGIADVVMVTSWSSGLLIPPGAPKEELPPIMVKDGMAYWTKPSHEEIHEMGFYHQYLLKNDTLFALNRLSEMTGVDLGSIPLNDVKIMQELVSDEAMLFGSAPLDEERSTEIRKLTRASSIDELARVYSLRHGTGLWEDNAKELLESGTAEWADIPCSRDELYVLLIRAGLSSEDAFAIMELVRTGRTQHPKYHNEWLALKRKMRAANLPEWLPEYCGKIHYLWPKAHSLEYVRLALRMAYFKVYYPEEYEKVIVLCEEGTSVN